MSLSLFTPLLFTYHGFMKIHSSLSLLLVTVALITGCRSKTNEPTPAPKPSPKEQPKKPDEPKPHKPYEGYEGYTLLHDGGQARYHYNEFVEVAVSPHLFLLDRTGKRVGDALADLNKDYEGHKDICETQLSEAGSYIALLAKYDFSESKHASRLLLLDRKSLKIQRNIRIEEPNDDNWVRQSFTLSDGSTYLAFSKRSFYRLTPEDGKLSPITVGGAWEYPLDAASWEDKGYFFRRHDRVALQFSIGSTSSTSIEIVPKGATLVRVYKAGGAYLIFRDSSNRYYLFSMKEGRVLARFTLTESAGRTMVYDADTQMIFFAGAGPETKERTVYRVALVKGTPAETIQPLEAKLYYRVSGRTESDSKVGLQMMLGINADLRQLYVSWLDQGRGGPLLHHLSKVVTLPLTTSEDLPVKRLGLYDFHFAADLREIFLNTSR